MSQYKELWAAYIEGEKGFAKYRDEAWEFAGEFVGGLMEFLGCEQGDIRLVRLGEEQDPDKTYTIAGALHYDEDGYWSMGIFLTIRKPEPDPPGRVTFGPRAGFLIKFSIKKENQKFLLRLRNEKHVEFDPSSEDDRIAYYQQLVADLKNILGSDHGLHTKDSPVRRIGFDSQS